MLEYLWSTRANGDYITSPFGTDEAEAFFENLKATDAKLARSADLQILRLNNRWDDVVTSLTEEFDPQTGNFDPQAIVLFLRALGETGRPDELVSTYEHFRSIIDSLALPYPLRNARHTGRLGITAGAFILAMILIAGAIYLFLLLLA